MKHARIKKSFTPFYEAINLQNYIVEIDFLPRQPVIVLEHRTQKCIKYQAICSACTCFAILSKHEKENA
jgi:hypothetical protein